MQTRTTWPLVGTGIMVLALVVGCGGAGTGGGEDSVTADTVPRADKGISEDGAPADTGILEDTTPDTGPDATPPAQGIYEVLVFTTAYTCVGCEGVSICGAPPMSGSHVITVDADPNTETGLLFAAERWEAPGRALPLGTCEVLTGETLYPVTHPPHGVDVQDAGDLVFSGAMPLMQPPITLGYFQATHNYPSVARGPSTQAVWPDEYLAGTDLAVEAGGGADWAAFTAATLAPEPFDILTPHTDEDGQISNVATDQPLEVTWTGGGGFDDVVIQLWGEYCPAGIDDIKVMVHCHVPNDGAFTIPGDLLASLEWPNYMHLAVTMSEKIVLDIPGVEGEAAWSVRARAELPIYHDPAADPAPFDCTADVMEAGFAGEPCSEDGDCGGGCCLPQWSGMYFYQNYCSIPDCGEGGPGCPVDALCVQDYWDTPWETYCAKFCETDQDCRGPEYACLPQDGGATACVPAFW